MKSHDTPGRVRRASVVRALAAVALAAAAAFGAGAATVEDELPARLAAWRAAASAPRPGPDYDRVRDEALAYFSAHRIEAGPAARRALLAELAEGQPSGPLVLDLARFLQGDGDAGDRRLAADAAAKLDPRAPALADRRRDLFELLLGVAIDADPRLPVLADAAFLVGGGTAFPVEGMTFDDTVASIFLYGAYGPTSEAYLLGRLGDPSVARRVVEALVWLGSPASIAEVGRALERSPDHETFLRVSTYMMQTAGPQGRAYMIALDPARLAPPSRDYLAKVRKAVRDMSVRSFLTYFYGLPGDTALPDDEVSARLARMVEAGALDDRTNPTAIVQSGLAAADLIPRLIELRTRTFRRASKAGFADAQIVNAVIAALRYRDR
jgi:hypothetical protein